MRVASIVVAVATLLSAGSASAAKVSDAAYLAASRCSGLATGVTGVVDAEALSAFVKAAGASRSSYVAQRAEQEFGAAKREARRADKTRVTAELTGPCSAYLGDPEAFAKRSSSRPNS